MSYFQVINLFLIFGLISYSYEFNVPNNKVRRRTRESVLKGNTQDILNQVMVDQGALGDKIREAVRRDEDTVRDIIQNIMAAANTMAQVGSRDISSITQWTNIQNELRNGVNVIITAYQRYIDLHRETCTSIEVFAKTMISKYESELSTINQLVAPTTPTGIMDMNSPDWAPFMSKYLNMMSYTRVHQGTLGTAIDCIGDLTKRTLEQQSIIMNPSPNTITVHIAQPADIQYGSVRALTLPCNEVTQYNGYQSCSNAIADITQRYATNACACSQK